MNNLKENVENYNLIDIAKYICAIFIMQIHVGFWTKGFISYILITSVITRVAVPFFFASTGFFFFRKIEFENEKITKTRKNLKILFNYEKRIVIMYILWCVIYGIFSYSKYAFMDNYNFFKDYLLQCITVGCKYQFWYIISLIIVIPVLYFSLTFIKIKYMAFITFFIYLTKILLHTYNMTVLTTIIAKFYYSFSAYELPIYVGIPLTFVGVLSLKYGKKINFTIKLICLLFLIFFNVIEVFNLVINFSNILCSYIFTTPFLAFFMFSTLCDIKVKCNKNLCIYFRKTSTLIYCMHPLVCDMFSKYMYTYFEYHTFMGFLLRVILCTAVAFLIIWLSSKKILKFLHYLY